MCAFLFLVASCPPLHYGHTVPAVKLLCIEQGNFSLEAYMDEFLNLTHQSPFPDNCLCFIFETIRLWGAAVWAHLKQRTRLHCNWWVSTNRSDWVEHCRRAEVTCVWPGLPKHNVLCQSLCFSSIPSPSLSHSCIPVLRCLPLAPQFLLSLLSVVWQHLGPYVNQHLLGVGIPRLPILPSPVPLTPWPPLLPTWTPAAIIGLSALSGSFGPSAPPGSDTVIKWLHLTPPSLKLHLCPRLLQLHFRPPVPASISGGYCCGFQDFHCSFGSLSVLRAPPPLCHCLCSSP